MNKRLISIFCLVMAVVLAAALCACKEPEKENDKFNVTFYESDGVTAIKQVEVESGKTVEQPELTKEGYQIKGKAEYVIEGDIVDEFKAMVEAMFKGAATAKGALLITPDKVIVTTPGGDNKKEL